MIVPEEVRKCVAFLAIRRADEKFQLAGSVFWMGRDKDGGGVDTVYAVTARHVIDAVRNTGVEDVWFRINHKGGNAGWYRSPLKDWYVHPSDASLDVAILKSGLREEWDHLIIPYSLGITDERMKEHEVGPGDEVFITGLFRHHHGSQRNIPIVRVGNIACLAEERVETRDYGPIDALLVEARSIGGLSGSPVFLNLGITRMIEGNIKHATGGQPIFFLLGLVHGHYDVHSTDVDGVHPDELESSFPRNVNTGIAIVVPLHSVRSVIDAYEALGRVAGESDEAKPADQQ